MNFGDFEMIEIKPNRPYHMPDQVDEFIDAGFGLIKVTRQGKKFRQGSNQCCIVTFHDLGLNSASNFQAFFNYHLMQPVLDRMPVYHINAPGQEDDAEELPDSYTYPSMNQLADSVRTVCNYYGINQMICLGVGLGANVMVRVALKNPEIVEGVFLINPVPTAAGWMEWVYQRRNIYYLQNLERSLTGLKGDGYSKASFPQCVIDYLTWHHFGNPVEERCPDLVNLFKSYFSSFRVRPRNLAALMESYLARDDVGVTRDEGGIECPSLIVTGNDSPFLEDSIQMNQRLRPERSGWMKLFDSGMALDEQPGKISEAFILFVQGLGIGLLTHVKIR